MAVITYETPDGLAEIEVPPSEISYDGSRHHWKVKTDERNGREIHAYIPRERVFAVEVKGKRAGTQITRS
ncbi:hypothetical protein EGH24_08580 [Halonotius terrestris]|uniref:Uncharacterized protein n=1 Tax=Halonotius terrestris TaxID=2487750 RepID=A0A8J8PC87_9EURY|nr:hypothetical protein [Halonotius terrestris]TQQ81178.1 hypothetical protein EGH24_08580 [Halonotius terrestris]